MLGSRGGAGRETVCSFFNPLVSLYIYYDQYEKIWRKNKIIFFPRFVSMEMAAIFDFRALAKVHITLKTASSNAVLHTHRRHINEETYSSKRFTFVA